MQERRMRTSKRVLMLVAATMAAAFALSGAGAKLSAFAQGAKKEELSESYRGSQQNNVAYQKIAPFKLMDNLYYVGPGFVSAWLVPTSQGVIMIDTAQEPYVDHVIDSIKKSGFALTDIKYIILSHGHLDHFGGAAKIQELSGARVVALEEDWRLIEAAGNAPRRGGAPSPRVTKRGI